MAWYVYGIVSTTGGPLPELTGVDGQPVRLLGTGDPAVAASAATETVRGLEQAAPEQVLAAVRAHDDTVAAIADDRAVLPVRFGTVLPDDDALRDLLADEPWGPRLAHVTDAAEWVVTVTAPTVPEDPPEEASDLSPGHAFFARRTAATVGRQEARRRAVAAAEAFHARLLPVVRDWRVLDLRDPETVARGAYLVPHGQQDALAEAADGVVDATVSLQGPLPPYRFADR